MPMTFDYKVRDRTGNLVEGQLEGDSLTLVVGKLREMGYLPLAVTPNEIAVVTRQLATMIDSGLSVVRSLGILAGQVENKELARILGEVRMEVERGSSLSAACAKHPKVFNTLFVTMVQAGEAGGHLDDVFVELASGIEKQAVLGRKVRSLMTYPI